MAYQNKRYDISMKCLAEIYPSDLAKLVFGPEFRGTVEFRPETLPIVSARESDLLLLVKNINGDFILHIEFQSKHESDIPNRMIEYYGRIIRHYKIRDVYSVVIYLNPKKAPKKIPDSYTHYFKNITTIHKYEVIKIWEIESNFIIDNNLVGLFPLLSLTKDFDLKKTYDLIESLDIDYSKKKELYACAYLLAGITYSEEIIESLTKEEIMLESVTYQKILEKGIIKGKKLGKEEGIKEGKEQDLLFILTKRFKTVPKRIIDNIKEIKDLDTLEALLEAAITVSDIAEFEKHLSTIK